jgi:urease accessory protein
VGGLRLELIQAGGKTRLGGCYQQMPLRVLPPFHFPGEPAALLYLINPTVGLMDGDGQWIDLRARSGVRALVTGQSANRIHPAVEGFATQQWRVRVEEDAQLVLLPGPAIPFRGCRYYQRAVIDLAPGACLIWGDVWFPGRYARDALSELYQFDQVIGELEVNRAGDLIFRDRFAWAGPWDAEKIRWHVGQGLAIGSLFLTGTVEGPARTDVGSLERSVFPLAGGDTCIRWCGPPGEVVQDLVQTALGQAARWSARRASPGAEGSNSAAWFLGSNNLAPTHWFS